jgi:hypothetical protein
LTTKGKGKGNLKVIHHFRKRCGDSKSMREKKNPYNPSTGTGGAWAAISQPEAMAATTWTVNPYGPAHPCRSLGTDSFDEERYRCVSARNDSCIINIVLPI